MYLSRLFLVHIQICIYTHRNACAHVYSVHTHTHTHTRLCFSFCFYQWDILHLCKMFLHLVSLRGFFLYQCMCIHFLILNSAISLLMAIYAVSNFLLSPKVLLLQAVGPPPGLESGLLSNTRKWIVWGGARADKARGFIGKGAQVESRRVREPRTTAVPMGRSLRFYGGGISVQVVSGQSGSFPMALAQPRWMPARRVVFLIGTSCCEIIHAVVAYAAWPGWVASVSVSPLTLQCVYFSICVPQHPHFPLGSPALSQRPVISWNAHW